MLTNFELKVPRNPSLQRYADIVQLLAPIPVVSPRGRNGRLKRIRPDFVPISGITF